MKSTVPLAFAGCVLLAPCALVAQTFKCTDSYGKITYSGKQCSDLGLKNAGEVKAQINTAPAYKPPLVKDGGARSSPAASPAAQAAAPAPSSAPEPEGPARRCFTVNTGKGTATRCNDAPPDADAPPSN